MVGNNENRKICPFFSLFTLKMFSGCLLCGSSMLDAAYIKVPAVSGPTVDRGKQILMHYSHKHEISILTSTRKEQYIVQRKRLVGADD